MKSMDMVVNKTRIHDLWSLSIEGRVKAGAHIGGAVASERREWPRNIVEDGGQKSPFTGPPRGHQPCP